MSSIHIPVFFLVLLLEKDNLKNFDLFINKSVVVFCTVCKFCPSQSVKFSSTVSKHCIDRRIFLVITQHMC